MPMYRIHFKDEALRTVGRDDFSAADDERAMVIARRLADAVSDYCATFELWLGVKRVDTSFPKVTALNRTLLDDAQWIVLQRFMAIRASEWIIADSRKLQEQTRDLLRPA